MIFGIETPLDLCIANPDIVYWHPDADQYQIDVPHYHQGLDITKMFVAQWWFSNISWLHFTIISTV